MAEIKGLTKLDTGRVAVPLVMLEGNMDVLLNNKVPVEGISLKWSNDYPEAVILVVHGLDAVAATELGFQTRSE